MGHTRLWPAGTPYRARVERVRSDGNWIIGDPADTYLRPWRIDGRTVQGVPRLMVDRWSDAPQPPAIPGWKYQNYSGFSGGDWHPDKPNWLVCYEYLPINPTDRNAPPVQLSLFDLLEGS